MSAIPTVTVRILCQDAQGRVVEGTAVTAVLTCQERYQGQDVPASAQGLTDRYGVVALSLFPNDLGSEGSVYTLTATYPMGESVVRFVAIPNAACDIVLGPRVSAAVTVRGLVDDALVARDAAERFEAEAAFAASTARKAADQVLAALAGVGGQSTGCMDDPGHYARDTPWAVSATNPHVLDSPCGLSVRVGAHGFRLTASPTQQPAVKIDLDEATSWDDARYATAAHRAGRDIYLYACDAGTLKIVLSANSTYPAGYDASTSRKIGGFHCLCAAVRHDLTLVPWLPAMGVAIGATHRASEWDGRLYFCRGAGNTGNAEPAWETFAEWDRISDGGVVWEVQRHPLEGLDAGAILPASVWDLKFRPASEPAGMVYIDTHSWMDIYNPSLRGGQLVSEFGGTIAHGATAPAFNCQRFDQLFGAMRKNLVTLRQFRRGAFGSNAFSRAAGDVQPVTAGGHLDTYGRRMVSFAGCEDCCGVTWQLGADRGGGANGGWYAIYDDADSGDYGWGHNDPPCIMLGADFGSGQYAGSRTAFWEPSPTECRSSLSARAGADAIAF